MMTTAINTMTTPMKSIWLPPHIRSAHGDRDMRQGDCLCACAQVIRGTDRFEHDDATVGSARGGGGQNDTENERDDTPHPARSRTTGTSSRLCDSGHTGDDGDDVHCATRLQVT
jgi:hypothetical protein